MFNIFICKLRGHNFGGWEYLASDSCEQVRFCTRDAYEERRQGPHDFAEWEYVASDSCEQVRVCIRDGYVEKRIAEHFWGEFSEWVEQRFSRERSCTCTRCGRKNFQTESTVKYKFQETDKSYDNDDWKETDSYFGATRGTECSSPSGYHVDQQTPTGLVECSWCGKRLN